MSSFRPAKACLTVALGFGLVLGPAAVATAAEGQAPVAQDARSVQQFRPLQAESKSVAVNKTVTLSGTATPNARIEAFGDNGSLHLFPIVETDADADGNWKVNSSVRMPNLVLKVVVRQSHAAGTDAVNVSVAPFAVTDGGRFSAGHPVQVSGTALPGQQFTVRGLPAEGGRGTSVARADHRGVWTVRSTGVARDDQYVLGFDGVDSAGSLTARVDPEYRSVERELAVTSGLSASINERARLVGTADAYSTVTVSNLPGNRVQEVIADAQGEWGMESTEVVDGRRALRVSGNPDASGKDTETVTVQLEVEGQVGLDPVTISSEAVYTNGAPLSIEGSATADTTLTFYEVDLAAAPGGAGKMLGEAPTDARGKFSFRSGAPIADSSGPISIRVVQDGRVAEASDHRFEEASADGKPLRVTSELEYLPGLRLAVSGVASPGELIGFYQSPTGASDGKHLGNVRSDKKTGRFEFTSSEIIRAHGPLTIRTVQFDQDDRVIDHAFTEGRYPWEVTSPVSGSTVTNATNQVTWTGTAPKDTPVRVETTGGRVVAAGKADGAGAWALRGDLAYDLMYTVHVIATIDGADQSTDHQVKVTKP